MAVTSEQRAAFGAKVRSLRTTRGLTMPALAAALAGAGEDFTPQAISGWERGEWAPRSASTVRILETVLDAEGELLGLLGLHDGPTISERVDDLERRIADLEASRPGPTRRGRR